MESSAPTHLSTPNDTELDPNRYASDHEAKHLRERLVDDDAEHELLTKRVARADDSFESAEAEFRDIEKRYHALKKARDIANNYRDEARARLAAHEALIARQRAFLHPVRKTPIEILCRIFEYCCPLSGPRVDDKPYGMVSNRSDQAAPFHLAQVCRRWRSACLGHSTLWTVIDLTFDGIITVQARARWSRYAHTLLLRSRSSLITMRLVRAKPEQEDWRYFAPLLSVIRDGLKRCQSLSIYVKLKRQPTPQHDAFTALLERPTPQLRCLCVGGRFFEVPNGSTGLLLANAPLLTTIRTRAVSNFAARLAIQSSVKDYSENRVVFDESNPMYYALRACQNLEVLTLLLSGKTFRSSSEDVRLVARALRELVIDTKAVDVSDLDETRRFCGNFSFPALACLNLWGDLTGSGHRIFILNEYKATLQQLTLLSVCLDSEHIAPLVSLLPCLNSVGLLEIADTVFTPPAFKALLTALGKACPSGTWLCPRLKHLDLATCEFEDDCDSSEILDAVTLRVSAAKVDEDDNRPAMLHTVKVDDSCDVYYAISELLAEQNGAPASVSEVAAGAGV